MNPRAEYPALKPKPSTFGAPLNLDVPPASSSVFFVYILRSKKDRRLFIGSGADPQVSLKRHNFGDYRNTNSFRPWILVYQEEFATKPEAVKREYFLKGNEGKAFVDSLHLK